ncbi:MAG: hypothetical protein ACKN9U_06700, partial [Pirellulaceae bacterium]
MAIPSLFYWPSSCHRTPGRNGLFGADNIQRAEAIEERSEGWQGASCLVVESRSTPEQRLLAQIHRPTISRPVGTVRQRCQV